MAIPVIRTERLVLDAHGADDLPACAAMWGDPAVTAQIGGRPSTREEAWHRILRYAGHWALHPFGYWAVRERDTGRYVGDAGLADWRRDTRPSFEGTPEAGWVFAPAVHGRGYAREAVSAILAWADARAIARTICIIDPANVRSILLAERMGYRLATEAAYRDATTLLFARDRPS